MSTKVSLYISTAKEEDSLYFFVETDNQLQPRWVFFFSCCRPTKSAMLAFYPYTQKVLDSLFFIYFISASSTLLACEFCPLFSILV